MKIPSIKKQIETIFNELPIGEVAWTFKRMEWTYSTGKESHIPDEMELRRTVEGMVHLVTGENPVSSQVSTGRFKVSYENGFLRVEFVPLYHDCDPTS